MAMLVALALEAWERSANVGTELFNEGMELGNFAEGAGDDIAFDLAGAQLDAAASVGPTRTNEEFWGLHRRINKSKKAFKAASEDVEEVRASYAKLRSRSDAVRADAAAAGCISRWFQVVACLAGLGAASG
ncbi:hypothetical protein, partial [Mycobacterium sp. 050134]|uniref:hypothetical protein n=1 Tax=Mycobacterium sp. 050134 TaxID=3096111 RepID=UPI002ED9F255